MEKISKEILVKDLCARLPYGVKYNFGGHSGCDYTMSKVGLSAVDDNFPIEDVKPYLFPLSSMTEEMIEEFNNLFNGSFQYFNQGVISASRIWDRNEAVFVGELECSRLIDWFNAHHIDYRGFIKKGLAIDATGLNIY